MVNTKTDSYIGNTVLSKPCRFKTIPVDAVNEPNPEQKILDTIANHEIENCVVKVIYSVSPEQVDSVNPETIKEKLSLTAFCSITPVVVHDSQRTTLPELDANFCKSPLQALEKYLNTKPELNKISLMSKATLLLNELNNQ